MNPTLKKILISVFVCLCALFISRTVFSSEFKSPFLKADSWCDNRSPEISDSGDAVWHSFCDGEDHIFLYQDGRVRKLTGNGLPGHNPHINSKGSVVWQGNDGIQTRILLNDAGGTRAISGENAGVVTAPRINDRGDVVWQGAVKDVDGNGRAVYGSAVFHYDGKTVKRLNTNSTIVRGPDINNRGVVVFQGWVDKPDPVTKELSTGYTGVSEIYILDRGRLQRLTDSPAYMDNQSPRINDLGQVVWSGLTDNNTSEVYLYDGKAVRRLTSNRSDDMSPEINNSGEVVWQGWDGRDYEIYYFDGKSVSKFTDNSYDDFEPSINDAGVVVWAERNYDGRSRLKARKIK